MDGADKLILFWRAPRADGIAQFQDAVGEAAASYFAGAQSLSLCRIGPAPDGLPRRPDDPADPRPPYDAALIARFDDAAEAAQAFDAAASLAIEGSAPHAFLTRKIPVLDRLAPGHLPALKNLALIIFHDDLPDSAAQRSWAQHAKLAEQIHRGAARYVRNWVERRGEGAPPARGIVEIDFLTVPDLVERYFVPPDGMARIIQDTGHFVQRAMRLYMHEENLRPDMHEGNLRPGSPARAQHAGGGVPVAGPRASEGGGG